MTSRYGPQTALEVSIKIERIVLDGFTFTPSQIRQFEGAVTNELIRLLGKPALLPSGGARASRAASATASWHHNGKPDVSALGRQVAAAVYQEVVR